MKYRADVDGLRAIAIILVLIYHGGLALFPSGFVGVDVFFVISGFLITTIIHQSLNQNTFSFMEFYNRRLWRLQPVFIALLIVTLIVTLLFYLPDDLIDYGRSSRQTSLFLSNVYFKNTTTGYFSPDTHQLPLMHTWSLSIEWQCYLILPLLMFALHRFIKGSYFLWAIVLLTIISFLSATQAAKLAPNLAYYQLSCRLFEFLIGSCVALLPNKEYRLNRYFLFIIGAMALIAIIYIASLTQVIRGYPNNYAFVVCLATAVLIAQGRFYPEQVLSRCLSFKPLVFVGVLSYSLYIWHWVVFSLLRYQSVAETPLVLIIAYLLIFVIAYLSWKYLEKPARQFKTLKFHYTVVVLVLFPILFTHLSTHLIKAHFGYPQRFSQEVATIYKELNKFYSVKRTWCISNKEMDIYQECTVGAKNADSKKAFMIGDSFANHYWGFMDILGKAANVSVLFQASSSCLTLPDIYLFDFAANKNKVQQECRDNTDKYYQIIKNHHFDYVILGQIWINYLGDNIINHLGDERSLELNKQRYRAALDKALKIITETGARPVLFKSTMIMPSNFHDCFFKHIKFRQAYDSAQCSFNYQMSEGEQWIETVFAEMKKKYPTLVFIDPKIAQCNGQVCKADINGFPMYRDAGHITDYASYKMGELFLQKQGNPLV
ncbi:MAG: acyltransferase [Legionella sp.]|nr:MAG: acyltransferase [Legionella sp.]